MNTDLPFSVFTANVISLLLLGTLYLGNRQKTKYDMDMRIVLRMMGITAVSNVADCCVYYLDGSSGSVFRVLVFLSGSWLFLGNVLIGYTWAQFLMTHLNIPFSDTRRKIYRAGILTALKNEMIFLDGLTGLYNRMYLEFLQKQAEKKKGVWVSGAIL